MYTESNQPQTDDRGSIPQPTSEIANEIINFESIIKDMDKSLQRLQTKLFPIINTNSCVESVESENKEKSLNSELGRQLAERNYLLKQIYKTMIRLEDNIQL